MAKGLNRRRVSTADIRRMQGELANPRLEPSLAGASVEEVARDFLRTLVAADSRTETGPFGLKRGARTGRAGTPEPSEELQLALRTARHETITSTDVVSFEQVKGQVPVFGARATVELDVRREVVSASMDVADVHTISTQPSIDRAKAIRFLTRYLGNTDFGSVPEPTLSILPHPEEDGELLLTWHFQHVPILPPEEGDGTVFDTGSRDLGGCCAGTSPLEPDFDYFVDAHSGKVVYFFPNSAHIDIPTLCRGLDENKQIQTFFGRVNGTTYEMENPFEDIRTLDLALQPIETAQVPNTPVSNVTNNWQNSNPAAVSAHVNAARVLDFLFRILRRNSIDDKGLTLENIVNCSSQYAQNPPEWINAVWWHGRMWYGQQARPGGFTSLSRHLDVIAHELFHGVTDYTAKLVYRGLSGALNESFSDIFGIIVRNWHLASLPEDVSTWNWEIGPGLGSGGNPLRDMANPSRIGSWLRPTPTGSQIITGYPNHMNQYVQLPATMAYDWGGVHWYSNIHNLAANRVLISRRANGKYVFTPEEVAVLYYLVLTRLNRLSDFSDALSELVVVSDTIYQGNSVRATEARTAITNAYDFVGIV